MSEADQCRALTDDGERCTRPAQDDGFCYQHDSDDETIDGQNEEEAGSENGDEEEDVSDNSPDEEEAEDSSESDESDESGDGEFDVMAVRETVEDVANDLVGHPLDGIIEITEDEDGWQVVVEMVERSAVPDTQDILGQYAIALSESGDVTGYRLRERYRRGDSQEW
ncbi:MULTISPECIES: gas vesicle protein GvpO, halophile-type [unclassified Haladaptatus]|uniref:gas vesicle protein GvpO, halophile-type n=1 Tax=unclassified Haladaptatus TaxID=2622732 RepID=UPI00209C46AA|nr:MULTISPECIES: gas vesicle protein GvpO [unclassified Haladaptatus]MCO8243938.1 gas vesicle protein [Haladaptatus sp. AB643]MCO8256473.1 gas vesicle protein [Haladaptatus sp. AB618]